MGVVDGWVIDMRANAGGADAAAAELAGVFVDNVTTPYGYVQVREETDGDPLTHELGAQTPLTLDASDIVDDVFTGRVAVLTGELCGDVCETFVEMIQLGLDVRTFGDTTLGAAGNPDEITLATDGATRLLSSTWFQTLGDATTVIEWNGIAPDEPVPFEGGSEDQVLEAAILWLADG